MNASEKAAVESAQEEGAARAWADRVVGIIRSLFAPFKRAGGEPEPLLDSPPQSSRKRA